MMKKLNDWLDSPWTIRRSFRASVISMVIVAIAYAAMFWDDIVEWYEGLKAEHWRKSWGFAWQKDSDDKEVE